MKNKNDISIICFGYDPWCGMWKRVQQFMHLLSQEDFVHHILHANPDVWTYDLKYFLKERKKIGETSWMYIPEREIEEVSNKVTVWNPFRRVPKARSVKMLGKLESAMFQRKLARLIKERNMKNILVWMNQPRDPEILGWIPGLRGFVFDWSDDWAAFKLYEGKSGEIEDSPSHRNCNYYLKASLVNLTVTPGLQKRALEVNPRSYQVPNATDYDNFSRAAQGYRDIVVDAAIAKYPKPVIGYVGYILNRIDFDLVGRIASRHPDWQFVFLGPRMASLVLPNIVQQQKNIHFLDPVPYKKLPELMRAMDVFTIPHHIEQATKGMSPIKIYDYLATGKPIVCTPVEGTADLKELLYLADSADAFEQQLLAALAEQDESVVRKRQAYAYENSWQARTETVKEILRENNVIE
jgi:glycosyltransferase involved in cell wall biosynthesis